MFALTTLIRSPEGKIETFAGSLYNSPSELTDNYRIEKYRQIKIAGWSFDEFGLAIYCKFDYDGNLLIVPAILLQGNKRPKRFGTINQVFTREMIEAYVEQIIEFERRSFERASQDVNMLVHDLRNISNSIYNAAYESQVLLNRGSIRDAGIRIDNVIAAQAILKIRTDVLDFIGNPASVISQRNIDPYRKVDKVCRSLKPDASSKNRSLSFSGKCASTINGPDIYEIVAFILIENAIKYSPVGGHIDVVVNDDNGVVELSVISLGPQVLPKEREAIFGKGVRADAARKTGIPGTGFGLSLLRGIVTDHFAGTVEVLQDTNVVHVNGEMYYNTKFSVQTPPVKQTVTSLVYKRVA